MSLGIKRTRPFRAVTTSFEGAPADILTQFEQMYGWARARGLRTGEREPSGRITLPWIAVLHDEENMAPEAARKIELWMPMDGAGPSQGSYTVKDLTHWNVAFMIHRGPMSRLQESIDQLFDWAKQKELPVRGRLHRRIYLRGVDSHPEDPDWEGEVQIPLLAGRSN